MPYRKEWRKKEESCSMKPKTRLSIKGTMKSSNTLPAVRTFTDLHPLEKGMWLFSTGTIKTPFELA